MYEEAKNAITSIKPITNTNIQKADFDGDQVFTDERPCQHRDNQRARVVQDRKSIERCNGLRTKGGISASEKKPLAKLGSPFENDDIAQYDQGEYKVDAAPY